MLIRVFYGETYRDIPCAGDMAFSIGTGKNDDLSIPDVGLRNKHIQIRQAQGGVEMTCHGGCFDLFKNGESVKKTMLSPIAAFQLDASERVWIVVGEECLGYCTLDDIDQYDEITIGRDSDNLIVVRSNLVSRHQLSIKKTDAGRYLIENKSKTNGTYVNKRIIESTELNDGDIIAVGDFTASFAKGNIELRYNPNRITLNIRERNTRKSTEVLSAKSEPFKRSPRIQERLPEGKIEIPAPPAEASKPEINWLSTLLPAGVTIAIAVTVALVFQNTMMMLYSLPMAVAGVLVSVANYVRGDKKYRRSLEERRTAYLRKLDEVAAAINEKREAQKKAMLLADPTPKDCLAAVRARSTMLWCRKPDDSDFVSVRLGTGAVPFSVTLNPPQKKEDELGKKADEIYETNNTIEGMPILCNIRTNGLVGLLGTEEMTRTQLQNMIFHLATHHCCTELKLVCIYNERDREELSWLADLPHTSDETQEGSYLACTQKDADALFKSLTETFKQREKDARENKSYGGDPLFVPYVLFVFFEPRLLRKGDPITQYLFKAQGLGIGCLMAAQGLSQLPKECTEIINLSGNEGELYNITRASEKQSFQPDKISTDIRREFGRSIRPLYCDEGIEVNALPKSYTFYQMLGINSMDEYDIGKHWGDSDILTSVLAPSAPIGVLENGERLFFSSPSLAEHGGSHALVAGTAGAGKSEMLLTIILSLALRYPPEEVSFLIIDFKPSIVDVLMGLPHVRGVITNLDGKELQRSLVSISAENEKRAKLFSEYNEKHPEDKEKIVGIREYAEKYRHGRVSKPLPHLFIVVDEFAEMKKQLPDIMNQFVSVAQVGRSLGVKLILATQSPSGVVDAKIRANILKQLCLKVANASESRDMIDTDLAARIKDAGRGYLKVDDNLQAFQSAYGGVKVRLPDGSESTQIREAVDAIADYCRSRDIRKLPDLFCPPLPERVPYLQGGQEETSNCPFGLLPIGIRDDPATQFMGEYDMDVFTRNTLIVGSQQMGKTNLLQTILRGVAERYSPEEVNVYILEFASLFLTNFETLPQVGGVVTLQEPEIITNLFRMLNEQIELRWQKLKALGVTTFAAYRESGARDLPQILLLVDNLAAAKEYFPADNDPLLSLCKEGPSLGISVAATAAQPVGGNTYLPVFANRIALYNNDDAAYNTLLGRTKLKLKELPGRCLVPWGDGVYECQSFLAFGSQREIDRAEAIRDFCREQTAKANGKRAVPIPFIPKELTAADAFSAYPEAYSGGRLMFGLDYATVRPLPLKLAAMSVFAVSGRAKDVRNFQRYLLTSAEKTDGLQAEFYIVDGINHLLQPLSDYSCVAAYSFLPEQATQMLLQIKEKAEERYARAMEGDTAFLDTSPTLVLMLNSNEAINAVSSDKAALDAWQALTGKLKSMNICTIFGNLENMSIPYGSEALKKIKDDRKLVFFDDLGNLKIGDLPYASTKKFAGTLQKGDGYLILGNEVARIRVPSCPMPEKE